MSLWRDWARGKPGAQSPPSWALYFDYAEQFGCHPQDVPNTVTLRYWERWKVRQTANVCRELWDRWRDGGAGKESPKEREIRNWALLKDEG